MRLARSRAMGRTVRMNSSRDSSRYFSWIPRISGLLLALGLPFAASAEALDPFTIEGLEIRIEAEDAVKAKEEALSRATQEGFAKVLNRVTASEAREGLTGISARQAENLLDRLSIDSETVGPSTYRARFTVAFSPMAVRGYLAARNVSVFDEPAPPVLMIPVLVEDGIPLWWDAAEPWVSALDNVRFEEGLTPVRLAEGNRADRAESRERILRGDRLTLQDFRLRHGTHGAVVVKARRAPGRERTELSVVGRDAAGPVDLTETLHGTLDKAADQVAALLSERWKTGVGEDRPPVPAERPPLAVRVLLHDGAEEWAGLRRRLEESGALDAVAVESIDQRSANILVWHAGDARDLAAALERHRLDLFEAAGTWLLQSY